MGKEKISTLVKTTDMYIQLWFFTDRELEDRSADPCKTGGQIGGR